MPIARQTTPLRVFSCLLAWMLSLALGISFLLLAPPAQQATAAPATPSTPASPLENGTDGKKDADGSESLANPSLTIAPTAPVWNGSTTDPQVQVVLAAGEETALPAGELQISIYQAPLTDAAALTALQAPENTQQRELATATVAETTKGGSQEVKVHIPQEALTGSTPEEGIVQLGALQNAASGVYLLRASFTPDTASTEKNFTATVLHGGAPIVWEGAGNLTPVQLGVIVPLMLPSTVDTLPESNTLSEQIPTWNRLLDQATNLGATLAIDPRIIVGLRLLGDKASDTQQFFLQRLENSRLHQFLLQFADADIAAQAQLGFTGLLAPTSFNFAGGTVAMFGALQEWQKDAHIAWPAPGNADAETVQLAQTGGYQTVILDSRNLSAATGAHVSLASQPGVTAFVTDSALSSAAEQYISGANDTAKNFARATLFAQLALAGGAATEAQAAAVIPRILALPRSNPEALSNAVDLLAELQGVSWLQKATLPELSTGTGELSAQDQASERISLLRSASDREATVNNRGRLLKIPSLLSGYQRARLLHLFSTAGASDSADFTAIAQDFRKRDAELIAGVEIVASANTQMLGTYAKVPVQLYNNLPFTATVSLHVRPTNAALRLESATVKDIRVPAETNVSVLVPVHSRVSNSDTGIIADVTSRDGRFSSNTATLPITLRSDIETIGMVLLSVLAVLLLGFGIFRSIKRKKGEAK